MKSISRIVNYLLEKVEFMLSSNWFNPFLTIYLNIRSFPFKQALLFPVFVYGRPRFHSLKGQMLCLCKIKPGMITFNKTQFNCPSNTSLQSEIGNRGKIFFRGGAIIGTGTKIVLEGNSILELGKGIKITDFVNLSCWSSVKIGDYSRVTHRCQIMDTNFHYLANIQKGYVPKREHPIVIGDYCWICNSTTVTGGSSIPNRTIVASNSVVNKDFSSLPEGTLIGGIPAKLISTGPFKRIESRKAEKILREYWRKNPNSMEYEIEEGFDFAYYVES